MLEEYFDNDLELHGVGATEKDIKKTEITLGLLFCEGYKNLLMIYDSVDLPGHTIYGLKPLSDMIGSSVENVINNTKFYKETQKWPGIDDWYIVSDDGRGNPIGVNPRGEVWLSDHDSGFEQVKLADNFEEFLYKLLTDTLYE